MKLILISLLVGTCLTSVEWPKASSTKVLTQPIRLKPGETFDGFKENGGKWVRYERGISGLGDCTNIDGGINDAVFILDSKSTLKNVILGPNSIKHVYCINYICYIENVWWEDVCKEAIIFEGCSFFLSNFNITGGGAKNGRGNIVQHNSPGIVSISNFYVENSKQLYSPCENCKTGYQNSRHAFLENVTASNVETLAGYNVNFRDFVELKNIQFTGKHVCKTIEGRKDGKEAKVIGYACDSTSISKCTCGHGLK